MDVAIRIEALTVGFGARNVIDGLSLEVRSGEILGLVGASGGGKTVLLRTILGLIPKRAGHIEVLGQPLETDDERRKIGRRWGTLFQQGALFSSLNVRENLVLPMKEYLSGSARFHEEVAIAKLELVGLSPDDAGKSPAELSGGMTKRVALARALALDPEIVFLDEPTSGLDPIAAGDFDELIRALQRTLGLTVFMVTHDLDSLNTICNRVAALADGRIVAIGPMSAMLASTHPWVQSYFRGKRGRAAVEAPR
jgi:phospholipid/cholesterol/gamma-HCH transport system ATP-binding protein